MKRRSVRYETPRHDPAPEDLGVPLGLALMWLGVWMLRNRRAVDA